MNLANLKTPGVYIDEVSKFPPSIAAVETAIPAFIGYTEQARYNGEDYINRPLRISSLIEYVEFFGRAKKETGIVVTFDQTTSATGQILKETVTAEIPTGRMPYLMYYTMQAFFANGGGSCWIVSVGDYSTNDILATALTGGLNEVRLIDEPTLLLFPDALSIQGAADYYTLYTEAIQQCVDLQDRFTLLDVIQPFRRLKRTELNGLLASFRSGLSGNTDSLKYAATYFPITMMSFDYEYDESTIQVVKRVNNQAGSPQAFGTANGREKSQARTAIRDLAVMLPASAASVGVYARVDSSRGVWKAPANESIIGFQDLTYKMNDEDQRDFNVDVNDGKSVNVIRYFTGKGNKIWGARTLAGNDNEWRYIPVRRFFNMVEESAKKATFQFVFEPNDINTWVKVKAMIENFLVLQWRAGALQGVTPEKAFYVRVGLNETMTAIDILEGRMIVEIGMAVVRPAEFIILRFSHKLPE